MSFTIFKHFSLEHLISRLLYSFCSALLKIGTMLSLHLLGHLTAGFFLAQSSMQILQNNLPHPLHSIGSFTTSLQIMQSNESKGRLGNLYLEYPSFDILLS
jgi:hypothetical protein